MHWIGVIKNYVKTVEEAASSFVNVRVLVGVITCARVCVCVCVCLF